MSNLHAVLPGQRGGEGELSPASGAFAKGDSASRHSLAYRADIDGLRAVAVLSVVFFHASLGFSGGFVGVDVFFVISGFLITSLITKDLQAGTFRFVEFWERRARRILPALFVMAACVLAAFWFVLLPGEYETLGKSVVALSLFSANFFFWRQTNDYFAGDAEEHPLLHTWSLAVEEQFYFIVPFLMWGLFHFALLRGRGKLLTVFLAGFAASLGLSIYGMKYFEGATFYLLPTRAWELLVGAIVAHLPSPHYVDIGNAEEGRGSWKRIGIRIICEGAALLGLACILAPVFYYNSETPFPGINALAPCLGAGLLIWANGISGYATLVSRALSLRPVVFIGLISYSLYLWHWPPLVFRNLCLYSPPTLWESALLISIGAFLAVLSWKFVETPFRKRILGRRPRTLFAYAGGMLLCLILAGSVLVGARGFPFRVPPEAVVIAGASRDYDYDMNRKIKLDAIRTRNVPRIGDASAKTPPSVLVWGDSHAVAILPAVERMLLESHVSGRVVVHAMTPPVLDWTGGASPGQVIANTSYNDETMKLIRESQFPVVILASYWSSKWYRPPTSKTAIRSSDALLKAEKEVVSAGAEPWVLLDVPIPHGDVPKIVSRATAFGYFHAADFCARVEETAPYDGFPAEMIRKIKQAGGRIIDPKPAFLDPTGTYYRIEKDGCVLYADGGHLTSQGAVKMLLPLLREAWADHAGKK